MLFVFIVFLHSRVLEKKKHQEALIKINQNELSALGGNYSLFENGAEFGDPAHPYTTDLDIFGPESLFQYLNRTSTQNGRERLAAILQNPCLQQERILENQKAVGELKNETDWRQDFQSIGMIYDDRKVDKEKILKWIQLPPLFENMMFSFFLIFLPTLTLLMIILLSAGLIGAKAFILYVLLIPLGIPSLFAKKIMDRYKQVSRTSEMLTKFSLLIRKIESLSVKSEKLNKFKQNLICKNQTASNSLKTLSSILTALDNRTNPVFWIFLNGLLQWDFLQMRRLENWQKLHQNEIEKWFGVIAETDMLNCLANFYYNHPEAHFPEILSDERLLNAENMGHPLIPREFRVNNPLTTGKGQFLIVTGANMAGKSTYLRTAGVNLILAMCGAPVCADVFRFKPVALYTSLRTNDSLQKNESYFYSELKRLKAIIDELKTGRELFIILDEILKGTNSKDKHAGSEALLKQLLHFGASGIVATHDVSLGDLQEIFPDKIVNRCFEVDIAGDKLSFDYKLRNGISKNMNATLLMREMGITV